MLKSCMGGGLTKQGSAGFSEALSSSEAPPTEGHAPSFNLGRGENEARLERAASRQPSNQKLTDGKAMLTPTPTFNRKLSTKVSKKEEVALSPASSMTFSKKHLLGKSSSGHPAPKPLDVTDRGVSIQLLRMLSKQLSVALPSDLKHEHGSRLTLQHLVEYVLGPRTAATQELSFAEVVAVEDPLDYLGRATVGPATCFICGYETSMPLWTFIQALESLPDTRNPSTYFWIEEFSSPLKNWEDNMEMLEPVLAAMLSVGLVVSPWRTNPPQLHDLSILWSLYKAHTFGAALHVAVAHQDQVALKESMEPYQLSLDKLQDLQEEIDALHWNDPDIPVAKQDLQELQALADNCEWTLREALPRVHVKGALRLINQEHDAGLTDLEESLGYEGMNRILWQTFKNSVDGILKADAPSRHMAVSWSFLATFRLKYDYWLRDEGDAVSTRRVVDQIIRPETRAKQCCYASKLQMAEDEQLRPYVGSASVYVCHAWDTPFLDLLDALERFPDRDEQYFFLDIFALPQHSQGAPTPSALKAVIEDVLTSPSCTSTAVVWTPNEIPRVLTRLWCLFEIFLSSVHAVEVHLMLPEADMHKFRQSNLPELNFTISAGTVEVAETSMKEEQEMLEWILHRTVGDTWSVVVADQVNDTLREAIPRAAGDK